MIVLQPTTPNDLHSFTTTTRSLNQPNASIAVGPQPVQQSMYQTASYPAHATFVYSPATNSVTQQQQGYSNPRSSSSLPARPSSADNIPLESAAYSLHSNSTSYRYDCNQMAGGQESRSPQAQSSSAVIANEGVGQNYGATSDPRASVGVSSSPQQASLGANMLPPLSEVLQQPPPPQQQQQPQSQQQGQHQQQHQQHQQPQQQVQNQQGQQPQVQVQNQQGQQQQVQNQNQQQQQPPTPQQQPPQQSQPQPQSGSSSPAASPTQPHHASSGSLMPPAAAAAAAAAAQSVTAGFYHQMGQYPDVSAYASQDGTYAAQASLMPPTQQQAAMVQQSMNQLGQQTSQLVTVVDPRLPPIAAAQGGDLQTANLSTSLVDPSVRRLAISTANMAMNQPESAGSSTASPIMPSATNALNNYQHLLNTPFMTATHPVMMAPPRSLHGRRDVADPSMHAMVERPQQKVYSFVPLPGINTKKRPRRRYDEIERHYACNWAGCSKAYGTLNHLNAHVQMQKHGAKRHPSEFKELRKMWRRQKREEEERKAAESAAVKQSSVATVNINGITGLHSV